MNIEVLISFLLASMALAISPGPDNIYVLLQSVVNGKKYGLATVFGLVSGILVHTTLVAFGVSALIKESEYLFFSIKLLGALYLFYIAFRVFKTDDTINLETTNVPKKSMKSLYKQGFLMNVLNPKVTLFFLAFFPNFLFSDVLSPRIQFYILGGLFMLQALLIFGMIAILAGSIASKIKENATSGSVLKWLQIIVFISIGLYVLISSN